QQCRAQQSKFFLYPSHHLLATIQPKPTLAGLHARPPRLCGLQLLSASTCERRKLFTSEVSSFRHVTIFRRDHPVPNRNVVASELKVPQVLLLYLGEDNFFTSLAQSLPSVFSSWSLLTCSAALWRQILR